MNNDSREAVELKEVNSKLRELVDVDRRVLSGRQTAAYIAFDVSRNFNIDGHKDLFIDSILKVNLTFQKRYNVLAGLWDVIDDLLVSNIVEKSRTRWGKFVPYLFSGSMLLAVVTSLFWLLPVIFSAEHVNDFNYMPKLLAYAFVDMSIEFFSNIRNVSVDGYISTITPYPSDRRRLLSVSNFFSPIVARFPAFIVEVMLDAIKNGFYKSAQGLSSDELIAKAMIFVGPMTAVTAGIVLMWYSTIANERVHQKIERPRIRDSLKIVFGNRPILLYMISNALGSFGTGFSTNDYYRQVLNWTTYETVAGAPSVFFQPLGFVYYNRLADRFSTRSLFMFSQVFAKSFYIPLFFYGIFKKDKYGKPAFTNKWSMLPVTAIWEILYACLWGVKSTSGDEMRNECNDYLEWKYGGRSEATLAAASAFITKIPARLNSVLQPQYKQWIGYDQTAYTEGRPQPEHAQKWIFAMATLFPAVIVLSSMVPMFWFNIDKATRDKMYRELNERRVAMAERIKLEADLEAREDA